MTHTTPAELPNLVLLDHPLLRHKVSLLRAASTPTPQFRSLLGDIATLMAYEVTRDLPVEDRAIETPLEETSGDHVREENVAVVPILRAGLGLVEGMLRLIPNMAVGSIGIKRDEATLAPNLYYLNLPPEPSSRVFIVVDPMLATGGSASAAVRELVERGAREIRFMTVIAAPEGVRRMANDHPGVRVFCAALDRKLSSAGYILPGLGDAGDRMFGTE